MSSTQTISDSQLNANRQNATQSTGPCTDEGKKRTRLNGLRHGLSGQTVVMPYESVQEYEQFCAELFASLEPQTEAERALADTIANDSWRLDRARAIEENTFALGLATAGADSAVDIALNQAMTYLEHAKEIQLLSLYSGRIARAIAKNRKDLEALKSERRRAYEQALEEAILLTQLAEARGETYDPQTDFFTEGDVASDPAGGDRNPARSVNGFGFSKHQIAQIIDRRRRLAEARALFGQPANPAILQNKAA